MSPLFGALGRSATYLARPFFTAALTPPTPIRRVERSASIRLPSRTLAATPLTADAPANAPPGAPSDGLLNVWSGGPDEPPEGPNGFTILADGSLLVTDPLAKRLLLYTPQGALRKPIPLGFPADSLSASDENALRVRDATTGEQHPVPGFPPATSPATSATATPPPKITLTSPQSATLTWPARVLHVTLDDPAATLLSIECLAVQHDLTTYVALERTSHDDQSDTIHLRKDVRRYDPAGQLICEVADLPLGYFIAPVDELRVHADTVYQLMTTPLEVLINLWHTSPTT